MNLSLHLWEYKPQVDGPDFSRRNTVLIEHSTGRVGKCLFIFILVSVFPLVLNGLFFNTCSWKTRGQVCKETRTACRISSSGLTLGLMWKLRPFASVDEHNLIVS